MSLISRKGLLNTVSTCVQAKRFRGKINIQRPQLPHFERAKYFAVAKPYYFSEPPQAKYKVPDACQKDVKLFGQDDVENKLQKIYAKELLYNLESSRLIALYHLNPMTAEQNSNAYIMFKKQNMLYKNYGKETMSMAVQNTKYETIMDIYISHNMMVFSQEADIKKLLKINKKFPQIVLLAGILDGTFLSKDELIYYSNIPNLQTAQLQLVQTLNSAAVNLHNQLNTHQQALISNLNERVKQLELDEK